MKRKNNNWIETQDGWVRNDTRTTRGWSPFDKSIPPVRDGNNFPLKDGKVDWNKVAEEAKRKQEDETN